MVNTRGRVQLQFRLDDPNERAAFDAIQSAPQRGKTEFVTNCILACQSPKEERIAELVAEKVLALLTKRQPAFVPAEKRKRGRPPKRIKEPDISLPTVTTLSEMSEKWNLSNRETILPSAPEPVIVQDRDAVLELNPKLVIPSRPKEEPKESKESEKSNEFVLDDDILDSMESFINFM